MPPAFGFGGFGGGFGHLEAGFGGQAFDRLHETGTLTLHDEADGIAMRATAEAVVMILVDIEARRLLAVERATAFHLAAGAGQLHASADHRGKWCAGAEFVQEGGWQGHYRNPPPPLAGGGRGRGPSHQP